MVLILALAGPWVYDLINVPAEYTCTSPNTRLYGDYCGMPLTGFHLVFLMLEGFIPLTTALFTGTIAFAERAHEYFLMLLSMMPALPPFSLALLIWKEESRALQIFNLLAWGIAGLVCSFWSIMMVAAPYPHIWRLWGGWVYLASVVIFFIVEISNLKAEKGVEQPE